MLIPDPDFFHAGSRIRIKEYKYFNPKIVTKLSEIWSWLFIRDPGSGTWFFTHPRISAPEVKKAPDPGPRIRNTGFPCSTYLCWRLCLTARMTSDGWMVFSTTLTVTLNVKRRDCRWTVLRNGTGTVTFKSRNRNLTCQKTEPEPKLNRQFVKKKVFQLLSRFVRIAKFRASDSSARNKPSCLKVPKFLGYRWCLKLF